MTTRTVPATWHHTLEEWAQKQFGRWQKLPHPRPVNFAPSEAHRAEPYYALPVLLFVLSSRTRNFHAEFVRAVDLLRTSTSGFRSVLFVDSADSPALSACGWPVEQCVPEALVGQDENWLSEAAEHLRWAQKQFGATYVFAPRTTREAEELLEELALAYDAVPALAAEASAVLAHARAVQPKGGDSLRGGWDTLAEGANSLIFTSSDDHVVRARLHLRRRNCGVLTGGPGTDPDKLMDIAADADWNAIAVTVDDREAHGFALSLLRAGAQAVGDGPTIAVGSYDRPASAVATLELGRESETFSLSFDGGTLRFPRSAVGRVLETIAASITK